MDKENQGKGNATPSTVPATEAEDATRREATERLAALIALAPAAALLFDPHRAEATGDGSFE
jgi:hypothetical protein